MVVAAADWIPAGASALVAMYHRMPESLLWLAVGASHGKILMVVLCREEAAIPTLHVSNPRYTAQAHNLSVENRDAARFRSTCVPTSSTSSPL